MKKILILALAAVVAMACTRGEQVAGEGMVSSLGFGLAGNSLSIYDGSGTVASIDGDGNAFVESLEVSGETTLYTLAIGATAEFNGALVLGDGTAIPVALYMNDSAGHYWNGTTIGWVADPSSLESVSGMIFVDMDESSHFGFRRVGKFDFRSDTDDTTLLMENTGSFGFSLQVSDTFRLQSDNGIEPCIIVDGTRTLSPVAVSTGGFNIWMNNLADDSIDIAGERNFTIGTANGLTHTAALVSADGPSLTTTGLNSTTIPTYPKNRVETIFAVGSGYGDVDATDLGGGVYSFEYVGQPYGGGVFYQGGMVTADAGTSEDDSMNSPSDLPITMHYPDWRTQPYGAAWCLWNENEGEDYEDLVLSANATTEIVAIGGSQSSREWDVDIANVIVVDGGAGTAVASGEMWVELSAGAVDWCDYTEDADGPDILSNMDAGGDAIWYLPSLLPGTVVSGLRATIQVSDHNSTSATAYLERRGLTTSTWTTVASGSVNPASDSSYVSTETTFTDKTIEEGYQYRVRVRSVANGEDFFMTTSGILTAVRGL